MNKNLIPIIAKMLDVEIGEEFKIKENDSLICDDYDYNNNNNIYKFTKTEFLAKDVDDSHGIESWLSSPFMLESLITGHVSIVKLPWKPKKGDTYWSFIILDDNNTWTVASYIWKDSINDLLLNRTGWIYNTFQEAKDALPDVAKELNVEYSI